MPGHATVAPAVLMISTKRQIYLYSEVCKLFSQSSTDVPALLPCPRLPWQARGTDKNQFTKPTVQLILSLSISTVDCLHKLYQMHSDLAVSLTKMTVTDDATIVTHFRHFLPPPRLLSVSAQGDAILVPLLLPLPLRALGHLLELV